MKKEEKKRSDSEDLEQEMDSILKEEAQREEEDKKEEVSMEETMVKLVDPEEALGKSKNSKKNKQDLKDEGEVTEDKDSEADILEKSAKGSKKGDKTFRLTLEEEVKEPAKSNTLKTSDPQSKDDHATEDDQSNTEHKDEKLTSVPKEEENRSNRTQEEIKDEEEEEVKDKEEAQAVTPSERFDKMNEEDKQMVVNITMDKFLDTNVKMKFGYHGY